MKLSAKQSVWQSRRLGELFRLKHGYAFKSQYFADSGSNVLLTPGNFYDEGGFKLKGDKEKYYVGEVPSGFVLKKGDLLLVMTEQAEGLLGSPAIIPEDNKYLHNQRLGLVTHLKEEIIEKKFLYFLFNSRGVRSQIRASASGVKVRHTSPERIYEVKATIPSVFVQKKIASILSAYDDLIENNLRRIKILGEITQSLYREWFVKFRFPGHQKVKMVDSPLGRIPEGWNTASVGELCEYVNRGISPQYSEDIECRVINQRCIRDNRLELELTRGNTKQVPPEKVLKFGDVLINSTGVGTLGRVAQVYRELKGHTADSHVTIVRPVANVNLDYFGMSLILLQPHFERLGTGATGQTELSRGSIANTELIAPPFSIQKKFGVIASPLRNLAEILRLKNHTLRRTRDLLLPKLISGELDVSEIDIPIPEANA